MSNYVCIKKKDMYRISSYSFRGNYYVLNLYFLKISHSFHILCNENLNSFLTRCGNYSRVETIQGRKLYEEIWYVW